MRAVLTKEDVAKALAELRNQNRKPTFGVLHAALDYRGSMNTLVRFKAELDAEAQPVKDSGDGLKAFREVWALAADEGRKQQEALTAEQREIVNALMAENERLDGAAVAAGRRVEELEKEKVLAAVELNQTRIRFESELSLARAAMAESSTQAAGALQQLASAQSAHAAQLASLQSDLAVAIGKAHDVELKLARALVLLEPRAN